MTFTRFLEIAKPFVASFLAAVLLVFAVALFFALAMSAAAIFGSGPVLIAAVFAVVWHAAHKLLSLRGDMRAHEADVARYRASWERSQPTKDTRNV